LHRQGLQNLFRQSRFGQSKISQRAVAVLNKGQGLHNRIWSRISLNPHKNGELLEKWMIWRALFSPEDQQQCEKRHFIICEMMEWKSVNNLAPLSRYQIARSST
jgi:hypothetical protein